MSKLSKHLSSNYFVATQKLTRAQTKGRVVHVFVEGYDDVPFWRTAFNKYERDDLRFEISVPTRDDLAKGKKVLLGMLGQCGQSMIVCVDSDFDYLFQGRTSQSRQVMEAQFLFQTYTYAIENYACYPPSLRTTCVKATKNDAFIFDFEVFMREFSKVVYPLFLWYAYSALNKQESAFTLNDFRNTVRLHYVNIQKNGEATLQWLERQVDKRLRKLTQEFPHWPSKITHFAKSIAPLGVTDENVFFFMHGHTLQDQVVTTVVTAVCDQLRDMTLSSIRGSSRVGVPLTNELSYYRNSLRDIQSILNDNLEYQETELFKKVDEDLERFVRSITAVAEVKQEVFAQDVAL